MFEKLPPAVIATHDKHKELKLYKMDRRTWAILYKGKELHKGCESYIKGLWGQYRRDEKQPPQPPVYPKITIAPGA